MFIPKRIIFEKDSLNYDMGNQIYQYFKNDPNIEMIHLSNNRIKGNIPGEDQYHQYRESKNTLVLGVKKGHTFQTCKPSAHYQLPLLSGCIGHCQYCYLNTNMGDKPYLKLNVNIEDILRQAETYIQERLPEETIFEGAATSDPVPIEPYSNALKQTIEYFSKSEHGKFRFVTKYTDIDSLLSINHADKTEIRFTLNTNKIINQYEHRTPSVDKRIDACKKTINAGYPVGFIIAPVFIYENWKEDYQNLLIELNNHIPNVLPHPITFEIITHRYTSRAKNIISEVFPDSLLPMNDEDRIYKYGQFGYGKFVYPKSEIDDIKDFFKSLIESIFHDSIIKYII